MSILPGHVRIQDMEVRVRIAPSPTGIPHIGNTRTALYNYLFARKNKGKFIVRIEDTDRKRFVEGSQEKILEILNFLEFHIDEGPGKGGPNSPYIQSERTSIYQKWAQELIKKGKAYYCFCSQERLNKLREEQKRKNMLPHYDRKCFGMSDGEIKKKLSSNENHVIRLKVPENRNIIIEDLVQGKVEFNSNLIDDQVLIKSDGLPTYHLAATVDDHLMKITHVIRGVEWLSSSPKHALIYEAFGWNLPQFAHLPIILGPDKKKLSKRHGAKSAIDYRDEGYLPEAIVNFMAFLGWSYKDNSDLLDLESLTKIFDLERVRRANPIFDINKLNWFNASWIRKLSDRELLERLKPFLKIKIPETMLIKIIPLVKSRISRLSQVNDFIDFFSGLPDYEAKLLLANEKDSGLIRKQLSAIKKSLLSFDDWSTVKIQTKLNDLTVLNNWGKSQFFMTLRVAVTGKKITPPLMESMEILGKNEVIQRINKAINKI